MFHRTRNVARPGQPPKNMDGIEIGPLIRREDALRIVQAGGDVYTPRKKDTYRLARDAHGAAPAWMNTQARRLQPDESQERTSGTFTREQSTTQKVAAVYFDDRGERLNISGAHGVRDVRTAMRRLQQCDIALELGDSLERLLS